jgi:DNA-binding SARP family transcriptional activator
MSMLDIQLLGDFRLTHGDHDKGPGNRLLTTVNTTRMQSLLAYLLLHRDAPQRREYLAFTFWPDTDEAQALTNLRNLLHKLRQALPEPKRFLYADMQTVQWRLDAPFALDVAEFESLVHSTARVELEQAVKLYRGDLLPSCYDDWIAPERERLHQAAVRACERLIGLLDEQRQYKAAIDCGQRLLQLDPLAETTYRTLMRLHAADNDRAGALRVYHACVATLRDELAVEPAPETHEFYQRLLSAAAPSGREDATQNKPPLVGRQPEWKTLQDAWYSASSGKPACVILTGEAGIGKTRLAEELVAWTSRQGVAVGVARCYAAEGALAYAPVITWLRSPILRQRVLALEPVWATEAARLLPELSSERPGLAHSEAFGDANQRHRLFEALARAVLEPSKPLLLWIDDLQWCDRDTLEWLRFLLHFDPHARLLLLGTVRSEDANDNLPLTILLATLLGDGQLSEISLARMGVHETTSLALHLSEQALSLEQLANLYRETEGNPLFVVEMIRSGLAARDLRLSGSDLTSTARPLPPRMYGVLHARLAQLSSSAHELVGLAAAIGREFTLAVLARASDQDEGGLVRSLDELCQRRIVVDAAGQHSETYDFTHDKLREVAYNSLSAARRRLLHRRIAQALEAVYGQTPNPISAQIAAHYEQAGRLEQAIPYYQDAAESAQRVYANADAIRYYRSALALLEGSASYPPAVAASLSERLGDILHWTGQYDEGRALFQRALAILSDPDPISQARLHRKIGNTWREQYHYQEALHVYAAAERVLGATPPSRQPETEAAWRQEWIQVSLEIIHIYYWLGKVDESDALRPRLQAAIEQHGTVGQRAVYSQSIAWLEFRRNRSVATPEVVALARAALRVQQAAGNPAGIPAAHFGVGFALLWSGDPHGAIEPIQTALRLAEQTGDITLRARCLTYLTVAYRQCEQMEEARQCTARGLEVAALAQMPEYTGTARANEAWMAWRAGDLSRTQELGHAALALWRQLPAGHASAPFQWLALWPLLASALHEAQLAWAVEHARTLLDPGQQRLPDPLITNLEQAIHAWDEGESEAAQAQLQQAVSLAQQMRYL